MKMEGLLSVDTEKKEKGEAYTELFEVYPDAKYFSDTMGKIIFVSSVIRGEEKEPLSEEYIVPLLDELGEEVLNNYIGEQRHFSSFGNLLCNSFGQSEDITEDYLKENTTLDGEDDSSFTKSFLLIGSIEDQISRFKIGGNLKGVTHYKKDQIGKLENIIQAIVANDKYPYILKSLVKDFNKYQNTKYILDKPDLYSLGASNERKISKNIKIKGDSIRSGSTDNGNVDLKDEMFLGKLGDENDLQFLKIFQTRYFQNKLKNDFNFHREELSLQEQIQFYRYLAMLPENDALMLQVFSKEFSNDGIRTFLSLEHGGKEMGDKILVLGEKLPTESAQSLFGT